MPLLHSTLVFTLIFLVQLALSAIAEGQQSSDSIRGTYCYRYSDDQSYKSARDAAYNLALKEAIRSHRVYIEAATRVKNFQLEDDIIATTSTALLKDVTVEREERKPQEVCMTLKATLNPKTTEDAIRQRLNAKEVANEAKKVVAFTKQEIGLKVWTNKQTNTFLENDQLIIYVRSDRDAYLKLDYFQADGTVVHLVPNIYRGQAKIQAGTTYTFGDSSGPEQFIVRPPYGDEAINAMLSLSPFEVSETPTSPTSDSRTYIRSTLRGIAIRPAAVSVGLKTESKAANDFRKIAVDPIPTNSPGP